MKTIFFKTTEAFNNYLNAQDEQLMSVVKRGTVSCECGETTGAHIFFEGVIIEKVVLDEFCYDNADRSDKGE
jgi:hypothetical protein